MRISDWSSDGVLFRSRPILGERPEQIKRPFDRDSGVFDGPKDSRRGDAIRLNAAPHNRLYARLEIIVGESGDLFRGQTRKSVVEGQSGSVRVDLGGHAIIKTKNHSKQNKQNRIN